MTRQVINVQMTDTKWVGANEARVEYLAGALVIREGERVLVSFSWTVANTDSVQLA